MIARGAAWILDRYAAHRRRVWERVSRDAIAEQERALLALVERASQTRFGREHDLAGVVSIASYQTRVPLGEYLDFKPRLEQALGGDFDVLWPGRPTYWVKTSGTTAGDKVLPVTSEAFASHRRGGWDALAMAAELVGGRQLFEGPMLFLGGCTTLTPIGAGGLCGGAG